MTEKIFHPKKEPYMLPCKTQKFLVMLNLMTLITPRHLFLCISFKFIYSSHLCHVSNIIENYSNICQIEIPDRLFFQNLLPNNEKMLLFRHLFQFLRNV